jgi:SNF2 family DNA or RNA helicase
VTGEPFQILEVDDAIIAEGIALTTPRARRFFGIVLFGEQEEPGRWRIPLRRQPATAVIERIAAWAVDEDLVAEAHEERAQAALEFLVQRRRSYERTREAASAFQALDGSAPVTRIDDDELDRRLHAFGWNDEARRLRDHQRRGVLHALHAQHAANFSVPGSGKTTTTLAVLAAHRVAETVDAAVMVGPLSSFRPWETEAEAALPGVLRVQRLHNMTPDQRRRVYPQIGPDVLLLMSYSAASTDEDELRELGLRLKLMLIVDESHRVKRFMGGTWTPALIRVAERATTRIILSGTPMPHSARDLWSQFTILWPGRELVGSRATHVARINRGTERLVRYLAPFYTRTPKERLGLTPYTVRTQRVDAPEVQAEVYRELADGLRRVATVEATLADRLAALRRARPIRLLQAASNPSLLTDFDDFFHVPAVPPEAGTFVERLDNYPQLGELPGKMGWVLDRLGELHSQEEKAVVWTSFLRNIDQFTRLVCERYGEQVFQVDGRVPAAGGEEDDELDDNREQRIDRFLESEGFAVLVANPAACAESISLHSRCHRAFYLDRTYDCARWLQSIDRIHRLGLPEGVQVEVHVPQLYVDDQPTIDGLVETSLARKEDAMTQFLRGAELRDAMLNEQDTINAAEGDDDDLVEVLRYLSGQTP